MKPQFYVFALLFLVMTCSDALSQEDYFRKRITYDFQKTSLEEAVLKLSELGNFNVSYNAALLDPKSVVASSFYQSTIESIFKDILPNNLEAKASGDHVVLVKRADTPKDIRKEKFAVKGKVLNPKNNSGIDGVLVFDMIGLVSTITDQEGKFSIILDQSYQSQAFSFSKAGFTKEVVLLPNGDQEIVQKLNEFDEKFESKKLPADSFTIEKVKFVERFVDTILVYRSKNFEGSIPRNFQMSLWPGISTNLKMGGLVTQNFSINIFGGYNYGLDGLELGGLFNINRKNVHGAQFAGLANFTGEEVKGAQFAGIGNLTRGKQSGLQMAGIYNATLRNFHGGQFAGISNLVVRDFRGLQMAGISNVVFGNSNGLQFSGIINTTRGNVKKVQFAGIGNLADKVSGMQSAGVVNVAKDTVNGLQMAGVANYSRYVGGVQMAGVFNVALDSVKGLQLGLINFTRNLKSSQIGLINYADSASGIPFGFLSLVRKGGYQTPSLASSEFWAADFSFKIGVRRLYNIFSVAVGWPRDDFRYAFGYGLGNQTKFGSRTVLNTELFTYWIRQTDVPISALAIHNRMLMSVGYKLKGNFTISAGPTFNVLVTNKEANTLGLQNLAPSSFVEGKLDNQSAVYWVGGLIAFHW